MSVVIAVISNMEYSQFTITSVMIASYNSNNKTEY